jgi:hypothetical protein
MFHGIKEFYSVKTNLFCQEGGCRRTHLNTAGLSQLFHGPTFHGADAAVAAQLPEGLGQRRIGIPGHIDPRRPALGENLPRLLKTDYFFLRSQLFQHALFPPVGCTLGMAKFAKNFSRNLEL